MDKVVVTYGGSYYTVIPFDSPLRFRNRQHGPNPVRYAGKRRG